MKYKGFIAILLTIVLTMSLFVPTYSLDEQKNIEAPIDFALKQISMIDDSDIECPWSDKTEISSTITLYNLERNPNGYIFKLETGNIASGFIQIHSINGTNSIYCYAYEGDSEVECMINHWNLNSTDFTCIYFLGCFKYLIENDEKYLDLATNSYVEYTQNDLKTIENAYISQIAENPVSIETTSNINSRNIVTPYGSDDEFTWPIMSDFNNLDITYNDIPYSVYNHCAPTAATAIVRYLNHLGRTQCSAGESLIQTFTEMFIALNTNEIRFDDSSYNGLGTSFSQIVPGFNYYAVQNGYTLTVARPTSVTLSGMKSHLNNNRLLMVEVQNFDGTSGYHSVVVTGYSSHSEWME